MGGIYIRSDKIITYTMNKSLNHYEEPRCSSVEFEVGGAVLTSSGLDQDKFTLDQYDNLKDVEW